MLATDLYELLAQMRSEGRASAKTAIESMAAALAALPEDFSARFEADALERIAEDGARPPAQSPEVRGDNASDADRDGLVLPIEDSPQSLCFATLKPNFVRFASRGEGEPFAGDVVLEDTIRLDPAKFAPGNSHGLQLSAHITITSTAARSGTPASRHDGAIVTEFKIAWSAPQNEAPVTEAPLAEAPVAEAPVTEAPVTEAPVAEAPVAEAPDTEEPTPESPAAP
jgi:hypothetical protein